MEFVVNFRAVCILNSDVRETGEAIEGKRIGTKLLSELNLTEDMLKMERIYDYSNNIRLTISQKEAEKTKLFEDRHEIYVNVSQNLLEPFFDIAFKEDEGRLVFEPKLEEILNFWRENNYAQLILSEEDKTELEENRLKDTRMKEIREKAKKEEEENKLKREQEKTDWILKHGSQYLKDCLELGQYAHKEYITERANLEFPDFQVDYDNSINWKDRYSPSQKAIDELKRLRTITQDSNIIWLTDDGSNDCDFESCEAIIIRRFLGRYDLFKVL